MLWVVSGEVGVAGGGTEVREGEALFEGGFGQRRGRGGGF